MARGDSKKAAAYEYNKGLGAYNNSTDVFKWALCTDTYASVDADATTLNISNLTVIASAGNYVSGESLTGVTWTQSGSQVVLDANDFSFTASASNPVTGRIVAIYNDTSASKDIVAVVDITTDGTTVVDTTQGFTYTVNAGGICSSDRAV